MGENKPLVKGKEIRLAILGKTPGNGHPYSWSAMFNGYDRDLMTKECPYTGIPAYLNIQPEGFQIPNVKVTHICTSGEGDFTDEHVARCALIPNVVENPEDSDRESRCSDNGNGYRIGTCCTLPSFY